MMLFFSKLKEPVFLKESNDVQRQPAVLKALELQLSLEGKKIFRAAVISITGIGGVGKTALANWAIYDAYKKEKY